MPSSGIIAGVGPDGKAKAIGATPEGELKITQGLDEDAETPETRLLRTVALELQALRKAVCAASGVVPFLDAETYLNG